MENQQITYPYLGRHYLNEKPYVVLFLEPEHGVCVANETGDERFNIGKEHDFDESLFEILPPNECVRLSN